MARSRSACQSGKKRRKGNSRRKGLWYRFWAKRPWPNALRPSNHLNFQLYYHTTPAIQVENIDDAMAERPGAEPVIWARGELFYFITRRMAKRR